MLFTERREYKFDPELGNLLDTRVAQRLFHEYTVRFGSRPRPTFYEVDRSVDKVDPLYHMPVATRTPFSRTLEIPALNYFQKPKWKLTKLAITYQRRDQFSLSYLGLREADWWPLQGDQVGWCGYRYTILEVVLPPECYLGQTGVWTGLAVDCIVPADGDAVQGWAKPGIQSDRSGLASGN